MAKMYKMRIGLDENCNMPQDLLRCFTLWLGVEFSGFRLAASALAALKRNRAMLALAGNPDDPLTPDGDGWRHKAFPYWLIRVDEGVAEVEFDRKQ